MPLGVSVIGWIGVVVAAMAWRRRPSRWLLALMLAIGVTAGVSTGLAVTATAAVEAQTAPLSMTQTELGAALFVAKGCTVCHQHQAIERPGELYTDVGPNLSDLTLTPAYLQLWLKDPLAVKTDTNMPNLELSEVEIEALIAFLTTSQE